MKKLNYFSPLPPLKSGISDYSAELLKELSKYFKITAYVDNDYSPRKSKFFDIKKYRYFRSRNKHPTIYNIGNSGYNAYIYNALLKNKGIVILHDSNLQGLNFSMQGRYWSKQRFLREIILNHRPKAVIDYLRFYLSKLPEINFKENNKRKKINSFLSKGWNQLETDRGISFRWTEKKAEFQIKDKRITEIILNVYSEFPAEVTLIINIQKEKFKITRDKYQWIKMIIVPQDVILGKILVFKPLSFFSKIIHIDRRELGLRVADIRYKVGNKYKRLDMFKELTNLEEKEEEKAKYLEFIKLKEKILYKYPFNKKAIKSAKAIITHNNYIAEVAKKIDNKIPIKIINEGVYINKPRSSKKEIRKKLCLEKYDFIVCSFGVIQKHKRIEQALEAFSKFLVKNKKSVYIIIGPPDETIDLDKIINKYKLKNKVILTGYIPHKKAMEYIYSSDVCVNLRFPSTGCTSATLIKSLSVGTPCLITNLPENEQFPNSCVLKIKKDNKEIENIIKAFDYLKNNPLIREEMSFKAIEYIKENHLWRNKAKEIVNFIHQIYGENSNN